MNYEEETQELRRILLERNQEIERLKTTIQTLTKAEAIRTDPFSWDRIVFNQTLQECL